MSLIAPDDHATMWAIIAGGSWLAIWLEQNYRWAMRLSGPVIALLIAMALSNTGIVSPSSPAADFVEQWLVPLAVPLLLCRANVREIARTGRGLLLAFALAALGTLIGTVIAVLTMRGIVGSPNAEHAGGLMAASYIGGGVNFFAIKSTYDVPGNLTTPLLVADNFIMAGCFIVILSVAASKWFRARFPHPHTLEAGGQMGRKTSPRATGNQKRSRSATWRKPSPSASPRWRSRSGCSAGSAAGLARARGRALGCRSW
jgi:uncharacterized membrane protein